MFFMHGIVLVDYVELQEALSYQYSFWQKIMYALWLRVVVMGQNLSVGNSYLSVSQCNHVCLKA